MKVWTIEEEAKALARRFVGVNRAQFARDFRVKGGQANIYNHIRGLRPINLDAALRYAAGFGCGLEEISPRLALEVAKASKITSSDITASPVKGWPFSIEMRLYEQLPAEKKEQLDVLVRAFVLGATPAK